jgi:hypothetical protein
MTKNRFVFPLFIVLVSLWWGWTVLVDMFIVPAVFGHIDEFFKAGELGITVFSQLNSLEIIVSSVLVGILAFQCRLNKNAWKLLGPGLICWIIAVTYFAYLTPKITELTALWKQADLMGLTSVAGIPDIQQEHQYFHDLYVSIDTVKLGLLTIMLILGILRGEKWT